MRPLSRCGSLVVVDHLNYVTKYVERYRGIIDDYFILNEPWGTWWVGADDVRFFPPTNKVDQSRMYARFSNATYAAAKAANAPEGVTFTGAAGGICVIGDGTTVILR